MSHHLLKGGKKNLKKFTKVLDKLVNLWYTMCVS